MAEIKMGFETYGGKYYPNVRNIDFASPEDLRNNLGNFVTETIVDSKSIFGGSQTDTTGVYIYKSLSDEKKAFRLYKDWSNNIFCNIEQHPSEIKMFSEFTKKQSKVKLTEFPTSILSLNGLVIGQEIPFYNNSLTLEENIKTLTKEQIIAKYIELLNIFKELIINDIVYSDVHARNFMLVNDVLKLIDFDPHRMSFDLSKYSSMIGNMIHMINKINEYKRINCELKKESKLEDIEETIMTKLLK